MRDNVIFRRKRTTNNIRHKEIFITASSAKLSSVFQKRRAGVLLHPTSLPGPGMFGCFDDNAKRFIDFLADAGFSVWQTLPLGPTHDDLSPYNCLSANAINPRLMSVDWLRYQGWLPTVAPYQARCYSDDMNYRRAALIHAWHYFIRTTKRAGRQRFEEFRSKQKYWIEDYALYRALRDDQGGKAWMAWTPELRELSPSALATEQLRLSAQIEIYIFEQYVLELQWRELHQYARVRNLLLFGDMPMFVAHDSAEVWRQREYFTANADGQLTALAGVPPDYFSETGQLWGNPVYRWDIMQAHGFDWWIQRMKRQLQLFDIVRIDHFRGFESYWEIPAGAKNAISGQWKTVPGHELFLALKKAIPGLPVVAEDLGIITKEVTALRHAHKLPGMKVLQFGFDGKQDNPHLPKNYEPDYVAYTGTHDNDTTVSWFASLNKQAQAFVNTQMSHPELPSPWPMIHTVLSCQANWAILPMQDILGLGAAHRMNIPGTACGNWAWRFSWPKINPELAQRYRKLIHEYQRDAAVV